MTIAACYPCLEGVVFGADSTVTIRAQHNTNNHYNFCQKIFEFGPKGSSIGIMFWGMASLGKISYRTLIAEVADEAEKAKLASLSEIANLWTKRFWAEYSKIFEQQISQLHTITSKDEKNRTDEENRTLVFLEDTFSGGFCIGGHSIASHHPEAYEISYKLSLTKRPTPIALKIGTPQFWGCPHLINRVVFGIDPGLYEAVLKSDKWTGTNEDFYELVSKGILAPPRDLPIREAIDLIYANINTTIKSMKFSQFEQVCGGPIEIAVITTDRPFRWVCHKPLSKAIAEGYLERNEV